MQITHNKRRIFLYEYTKTCSQLNRCCLQHGHVIPSAIVFSTRIRSGVGAQRLETNYDGWYANADAVSMTAKAGIGHKDSRGMEVSGRTCASDGVSSEKGLYLSGGETNTYRIWVYSETAEQFHVTLCLCRFRHQSRNRNRTGYKTSRCWNMDRTASFLSSTEKQWRISAYHYHRQHP